MNKNQKLFANLQEEFTKILYDKYDKQINEIAMIQKTSRQVILDKIANIILEYNVKDELLDVSIRQKALLKKDINKLISNIMKNEYTFENDAVMNNLSNVAMDKYYSNCYLYSLGINYTLKPVKESVVKKIINKKINGKNYSDRIWNNKNKVSKQLKIEVDKFLNGKTDINSINKRIKDRFDVNWNNSNRLVRTEIAKVQTEANEYWAREHGIKKQLFSATLDRKTSKICQSLDGEIYDFDDSKKPIPPLHPNCRSCLIDIVDNWQPNERLNNETKDRINYQTYEEWKEQNI